MNKLNLLILPTLLFTACTENEFQEYVSALDLYTVSFVRSVSTPGNGDQKASLYLKVVSHDNKPMEGIFLKPHKLTNGVNLKACSKSNKDGDIACHFTSSKTGRTTINFIRGNREFSFKLDFNTVYQNSPNTKITPSKTQVQNLYDYKITSSLSKQTARKENLSGYLISTGIIFK